MKRLALLLLVATPAYADVDPGNWEITIQSQTPGVQGSPSFTQVQCLTRELAADPGNLFASRGIGCDLQNKRDSGSLITFDVECGAPPQQIRGSGSVRYSAQSLDGDLELKWPNMTAARTHISGRRLGGC